MIRLALSFILLALWVGNLCAQTTCVLDSTFSQDGFRTLPGNHPETILVQPDGKIVVTSNPAYVTGIRRFKADGSTDSTWGNNGILQLPFAFDHYRDMKLDGGVIYLCGRCSQPNVSTGACIAAIDTSGQFITAFGNSGILMIPSVNPLEYAQWLAPDGNGKIYVVGLEDFDRAFLARIDGHGNLDPTFDTDGIRFFTLPTGYKFLNVRRVVLDANLRPTVLADLVDNNPVSNYSWLMLARFATDGEQDSTFGNAGTLIWNHPNHLGIGAGNLHHRNGGGYLLTFTTRSGSELRPSALAVNDHGAVDSTFGIHGYVMHDSIQGLPLHAYLGASELLPSNRLLLLGDVNDQGSVFPAQLLLDSTGQLDVSFGQGGSLVHGYVAIPAGYVFCSAMDSAGNIYAGGADATANQSGVGALIAKYKWAGAQTLGFQRPLRRLAIHPNPVPPGQWLHIGPGISHLSLTDVQGRVLREWDAPDERIAVPDVPGGLYFLRGMDAAGPFSERLLIR